MSIACLVQVFESIQELVEVGSAYFLAESTTISDKIKQLATLSKLKDNVVDDFIFFLVTIQSIAAHLDEIDDVVVVELPEDLNFSVNQVFKFFVIFQDLDCNFVAALGFGYLYFAADSAAEGSSESVLSECAHVGDYWSGLLKFN